MTHESMNTNITSLESLAEKKSRLREELDKREEKMGKIWNEMFHEKDEEELNSPTQRVMALINTSAGVIDGAILGWKLYKKLGKGVSFFKKHKK